MLLTAYGRQAQADPPKTIIDIGTSPLCTTLRESVVPVLVGLHADDALINAGRQQLGQWSYDQWLEGRGGWWRMDRLRVEFVVSSLVRNFNVIDGILNDPKRFPHNTTDASGTTTGLHDRLQAVEDGQRATLNALYGPVDSSMMSEMMQTGNHTIQTRAFAAVPSEMNSVGRSVGQFVTIDGNDESEDPATNSSPPPGLPAQSSPSQGPPVNQGSPAPAAGSLDAQQLQIAKDESNAAESVIRAVDQCKKAIAPKPKA
jgi:hypothetical protein